MKRTVTSLYAAAALIAAAAVPLAAPAGAATKHGAKPPAAAAHPTASTAGAPTANQLKQAQDTLSLIVSALNSNDVPQETKNGLFVCLYEEPLKALSGGLTETLAQNKQVDASQPVVRLLALAHICGAPLPKPDAAAAPPKGR